MNGVDPGALLQKYAELTSDLQARVLWLEVALEAAAASSAPAEPSTVPEGEGAEGSAEEPE